MMKPTDARKIDKRLNSQPGLESEPSSSPNSREAWEKEQYACHYNYLFALLKEGKISYEKVAKRTSLKEHRLTEVLDFRLKPSTHKIQLFGHRPGFCYVCTTRMASPENKEPICLKCLHAIEAACLEIESDAKLLSKAPEEATPAALPNAPDKISSVNSLPASVSKAQPAEEAMDAAQRLQATQEELNAYKARFGELDIKQPPPVSETSPASPKVEATTQTESEPPPEPSLLDQAVVARKSAAEAALSEDKIDSEALLCLLEVDDQELSSEVNELAQLVSSILPQNNAPLRHFGFQRSKSHKP